MNIYVGNLPFSTTAADLESLFGEYGAVDNAAIINDRETGRSPVRVRGDGERRRRQGNRGARRTDYNGRNLKVNEARPARARPRR